MRITEVETILLRLPTVTMNADGTQDACIVRVHTDEGIIGLGEADGSPEVLRAVIMAPRSHSKAMGLRESILGEDPCNVRQLWDKMYRDSIFYGRRGAVIIAMSGIDMALWDIIGQAAGRPIHEMLGAGYRDTV